MFRVIATVEGPPAVRVGPRIGGSEGGEVSIDFTLGCDAGGDDTGGFDVGPYGLGFGVARKDGGVFPRDREVFGKSSNFGKVVSCAFLLRVEDFSLFGLCGGTRAKGGLSGGGTLVDELVVFAAVTSTAVEVLDVVGVRNTATNVGGDGAGE